MNPLFKLYKNTIIERAAGDDKQRAALKLPKITRIFDDSQVTERMMRCGIEARRFEPLNDDEIKEIAVITLIEDRLRFSDVLKNAH